MSSRHRILLGGVGALSVVVAWELCYRSRLVRSTLFPSAVDVLRSASELLVAGGFGMDVLITLGRVLSGLALATLAGIPLGLLMGQNRTLMALVSPVADFMRSVPVTTLYPIFVLSLGIDNTSKIAMVFVACVFIVALNTAYGLSLTTTTRIATARLIGLSSLEIFGRITIWQALPQAIVGLRVALGLSLIVAVLTELFMGANRGIGQRLTDAYTAFRVADTYAMVLLTGIVGVTMNALFHIAEGRLVHWSRT